jgi:hypothetical protein
MTAHAGPFRLLVKAGPIPLDGWSAAVTMLLWRAFVSVGWGYDDEAPLRPWPTLDLKRYRGCPMAELSLCGLYVALAWIVPNPLPKPALSAEAP